MNDIRGETRRDSREILLRRSRRETPSVAYGTFIEILKEGRRIAMSRPFLFTTTTTTNNNNKNQPIFETRNNYEIKCLSLFFERISTYRLLCFGHHFSSNDDYRFVLIHRWLYFGQLCQSLWSSNDSHEQPFYLVISSARLKFHLSHLDLAFRSTRK